MTRCRGMLGSRWMAGGPLVLSRCQYTTGGPNQAGLSPNFDTVDNCSALNGSLEWQSFSTVWGNTTITRGPFDPLRPLQTLLSDGISPTGGGGLVDAGDAPMPSARIDVYLTGTAGSLVKAEKDVIYSRDLTGAPTPHNLYAPFYQTYIPATTAPPTASGIDGPASGNNFAGFLANGIYDYWDTVTASARGGLNNCLDANGSPIPLPTGADRVIVYTDEHGEAIVGYNPWAGFVLNADANHRCYEITQPTLFGSTIRVEANYPTSSRSTRRGPPRTR